MLSQQQTAPAPPTSAGWTAARPATTSAAPQNRANAPLAWHAAACAAYAQAGAGAGATALRTELAARVHALTGCAIPHGATVTDHDARRATVAVDGWIFQLQGRDLVLLRPCAHCGGALFASPPLASQADLGYALCDWRPYHAWCEPVDPASADW
ncbi:MAG TPA: hypothetical protein VFQ25_16170 [Ktedonobacterales bacterium]|nr:hypothetical protein [Ktedonobacterales bacterium]